MLIGYVVMPRRGGYWVEYQEGKKRSIIAKCSSEKEAVRLMRARQDGHEQKELRLAVVAASRYSRASGELR
jgi:hypothetical protein